MMNVHLNFLVHLINTFISKFEKININPDKSLNYE